MFVDASASQRNHTNVLLWVFELDVLLDGVVAKVFVIAVGTFELGIAQVKRIVSDQILLVGKAFIHLSQQGTEEALVLAVFSLFRAKDVDDEAAVLDLSSIVLLHMVNVSMVTKLIDQQLDLGRVLREGLHFLPMLVEDRGKSGNVDQIGRLVHRVHDFDFLRSLFLLRLVGLDQRRVDPYRWIHKTWLGPNVKTNFANFTVNIAHGAVFIASDWCQTANATWKLKKKLYILLLVLAA